MNFLKEELARKKKEMEKPPVQTSGGGLKFFRRADLIKAEEEKRRQEQERLDREKEEAKRKKEQEDAEAAASVLQLRLAQQAAAARKAKAGGGAESKNEEGEKKGEGSEQHAGDADGKLPAEEVKERLRTLGHPVTLFGETEEARLARLRHAENEDTDMDFGLGGGHEVRNIAMEKRKRDDGHHHHHDDFDDDHHGGGEERRKGGAGGQQEDEDSSMGEESEEEGEEGGEDAKRRKKEEGGGGAASSSSPDKPKGEARVKPMSEHRRIYKYYRGLLKQWEQDLNARPEALKRTVQGKLETKTQKQCKDYIRPLFKLCKAKQVPDNIRANLIRMINFCEDGEFVKAHEEYLRTAIGNAPWPIGLTMVGIHERTGREKIMSNKVAHIMNNEMQRKYLTSVKRLIKFAQDKRPDVPPSKKVL